MIVLMGMDGYFIILLSTNRLMRPNNQLPCGHKLVNASVPSHSTALAPLLQRSHGRPNRGGQIQSPQTNNPCERTEDLGKSFNKNCAFDI